MTYFDYISSLEPNSYLKEKTQMRVQNKMLKKNLTIKKVKSVSLCVACLSIIVITACIVSSLSNTPKILEENTISPNNTITINTNGEDDKYGAQKIIIDDKVYLQYCNSNNKGFWGEDNGNVIIKESDIGDMLCEITAKNIINFDNWFDLKTVDDTEAKSNKFYKAKVYSYNKCSNGTAIIVKTSDDYYIFNLNTLTSKSSVEDIINIYSSNGKNNISKIAVLKNNKAVSEIQDAKKINSIIDILKSNKTNFDVYEIIKKGYVNQENEYQLTICFADETELKIYINKDYFTSSIDQINDYGYFELSNTDYDNLINQLDF